MLRIVSQSEFDPSPPRGRPSERVVREVSRIIGAVESRGDRALVDLTLEFDGVRLDSEELWVSGTAMRDAWDRTSEDVRKALGWAWDNVRAFHEREPMPEGWESGSATGRYGQLIGPLDRIGIYVPGGRSAYPSTLIMAAAPARVAGVGEVVVATPPSSSGLPHPLVLAAAHLAGVDRVLRVGGAHAVAAMALGTDTVPRVDKIVGPGSEHVQEAKRQLFGTVGIDILAGPSELVVVAEDGADPCVLALDLLAQVEHGPSGRVLLLTPSPGLAGSVAAAVEQLVGESPDPEQLHGFLESASATAVVTPTLEEAVATAGRLEAEHVLLATRDPRRWLQSLRGGAAVYLGARTPPAYGDFGAGPTHVLPTGGSSRFSSGLSVTDFVRRQNHFSAFGSPAPEAETLASAEGLWAHAESIRARRRMPVAMDANESPVPMPARVRDLAQTRAAALEWERYPPADPSDLIGALARYAGLPGDHVTIGAGADELILASVLALRQMRWLLPWPGFWVYERALTWAGADHSLVDLDDDLAFPGRRLEELLDEGDPSRTVVVAVNPANPTGNLVPPSHLAGILDRGAWLVVDEAYWEYSGVTVAEWVTGRPRLVVLRTLSKAFGLAGLRVGYMLAQPPVVDMIAAHRLPLGVSSHSMAVACTALEHHAEILAAVKDVVRERDRLARKLRAAGLKVFDSSANFLLVRTKDGADTARRLAARGYNVRQFAELDRLSDCVRITVGQRAHNDGLVSALDDVLRERNEQ